MDPVSIFGISASAISITCKITSLIQRLNDLKHRYARAEATIQLLNRRLSTIHVTLEEIGSWSTSSSGTKPCSPQLKEALDVALDGCNTQLQCLDEHVTRLCSHNECMGVSEKGKFLWQEDNMKEYLGHLDGEIQALILLLNCYQCCTLSEQIRLLQRKDSRRIIGSVSESNNTLRTWIDSESFQVPSFDDGDSRVTDRAFVFDDEVVNTQVYRETLARLRAKSHRSRELGPTSSETNHLPHPIHDPKPTEQHVASSHIPETEKQGGWFRRLFRIRLTKSSRQWSKSLMDLRGKQAESLDQAQVAGERDGTSYNILLPRGSETGVDVKETELASRTRSFGNRLDPNRPLKRKSDPERPPNTARTTTLTADTSELTQTFSRVEAAAHRVGLNRSSFSRSETTDQNRTEYLRQRSKLSSKMEEGISEDAITTKAAGSSFAERAALAAPIRPHWSRPIQVNAKPLIQSTERPKRTARRSRSATVSSTVFEPGQSLTLSIYSDHVQPIETNAVKQVTASQDKKLPEIPHEVGPENDHKRERTIGQKPTPSLSALRLLKKWSMEIPEKKKTAVVGKSENDIIRGKTARKSANPDLSEETHKMTKNRPVALKVRLSRHSSAPLPKVLDTVTPSNAFDIAWNTNEIIEKEPVQASFNQKWKERGFNAIGIIEEEPLQPSFVPRRKEPSFNPNGIVGDGSLQPSFDQRWNEEEHKKMPGRPGELILTFQSQISRVGLHHAASRGDQSRIRSLLGQNLDINSCEAGSNFTPLHCAVRAGHVSVVGFLLRRGAAIDAMDVNQNTPLHHATALGNHELVEILAAKGASLEITDHLGQTPLFMCQPGNNSICGLLLRLGANFLARDNEGSTPLHWYAYTGDLRKVDLLLAKGAGCEMRTNFRRSVLHSACCAGHLNIVSRLLEEKVDIESEDLQKRRPLHSATCFSHVSVVRTLLQKGASASAEDQWGLTPLAISINKAMKSSKDRDIQRLLWSAMNHRSDLDIHNKRAEKPRSPYAFTRSRILQDPVPTSRP